MANENYLTIGSALKFNGEAGADVAFSMEGVTDGAGRVSAQYDKGVAPKPFGFKWVAECLMQATPIQYGTIDFYLAVAPDNDSTMITGDVGATDAALGDIDQLKNLTYIGSITIEEANTTKMVGSGEFFCPHRYFSIVGVNSTGATINATDSNFIFNVESYAVQLQ